MEMKGLLKGSRRGKVNVERDAGEVISSIPVPLGRAALNDLSRGTYTVFTLWQRLVCMEGVLVSGGSVHSGSCLCIFLWHSC